MRLPVLLLAVALLLAAGAARAAPEPVDLALALVSDVSRSVDDGEFALQKEGYAAAFTNAEVMRAIRSGALGAIAVCYIEFAGAGQVKQVVGWQVIRDGEAAANFAATVKEAPRSFYGFTSISSGVDHAVQSFAEGGYGDESRRIIDVAGDGTNTSGRNITAARDEALALGITINGITIINENPPPYLMAHVAPPGGLTNWYKHNVIGGPGAFVLEVRDYHSFGEAMTRKLITEIALGQGRLSAEN
jgi:hypothetical protein